MLTNSVKPCHHFQTQSFELITSVSNIELCDKLRIAISTKTSSSRLLNWCGFLFNTVSTKWIVALINIWMEFQLFIELSILTLKVWNMSSAVERPGLAVAGDSWRCSLLNLSATECYVCYTQLHTQPPPLHKREQATTPTQWGNGQFYRQKSLTPTKPVLEVKKLIIKHAKPLKKSILGHGDEQWW